MKANTRLTYPKDPQQRKDIVNADYIGWWAGMIADQAAGMLVEIDGALYPITDLVIMPRAGGGGLDLCIMVEAHASRRRHEPA